MRRVWWTVHRKPAVVYFGITPCLLTPISAKDWDSLYPFHFQPQETSLRSEQYCKVGVRKYYRKRGSVSYIVREVHSVRERERDRERKIQREKDGSDVTIVALKLVMSFALLLAKNVHLSIGDEFCAFPCQKKLHLSFSPLDWRWIHTFRCQKRCTVRNGSHSSHCQMAWLTGAGIEAAKQTIEFPAAPFFFLAEKIEKMNKINTKNYWK